MYYHVIDQATCLLNDGGGLAVDFIGRVEEVDSDLQPVLSTINARLPAGVDPLALPAEVAVHNTGPQNTEKKAADSSKYAEQYTGDGGRCFRHIGQFFKRDAQVMFPEMVMQP